MPSLGSPSTRPSTESRPSAMRGRNECVCVEDARQGDIHEEALRSVLFFGERFVLQIPAHDAGL